MIDLKRIITKVTQNQPNKTSFSFQNFEQSLKYIAISGFHTSVPLVEKLQMLLLHIKNPCKKSYKVNFSAVKSRSSTPFSCETSGSEFDENKFSQRSNVNSYSQKLGLNRTNGISKTSVKISLDIETALGIQKKSTPSKTKSTKRIRISPKRMIPSYSYKSISQDTSPHQRGILSNRKNIVNNLLSSALQSRKNSQEFIVEKSKYRDVSHAPTYLTEKRHYRTMSAETYMIQSPRFGGDISTPVATDESSDINAENMIEKKQKNIEKIFKQFKDKNNKIIAKKTSKKEPHLTTVRKHRNYINKIRESSFTAGLMTRMIFTAWKSIIF